MLKDEFAVLFILFLLHCCILRLRVPLWMAVQSTDGSSSYIILLKFIFRYIQHATINVKKQSCCINFADEMQQFFFPDPTHPIKMD